MTVSCAQVRACLCGRDITISSSYGGKLHGEEDNEEDQTDGEHAGGEDDEAAVPWLVCC